MLFGSRFVLSTCLAACLSGMAGGAMARPRALPSQPSAWRTLATAADRERLRGWRDAWGKALAAARASGHGAELAAGGALFNPDAALPGPEPQPGTYRCRVTKLGAQSPGLLDYAAYPPFTCTIAREGDVLSFAKNDGVQRPAGLLLPGDGQRMIFLGTMMLSDERQARDYGTDPERDMIGAFERLGPARWRLVLPYPRWESLLDVIELVPAG
ncbi:DUF4893 domain-containing protein [Sphingomonas quercus]|nr:DUF4893 domain-containing protein [Sphingomonas quercus]